MRVVTWSGLVACVLCALVSSGCLENPAVSCKGGFVCAPGTVCDDVHGGCATPAQLLECAGKPDVTACSYPGVADGACYGGVCLPGGCGNGVLDDGEACDDHNRVHGDGCSADCRSTEACGNGVVDSAIGEACDDGNTMDGDSCHANCSSPTCGDGVLDKKFNEACDMGALNSEAPDAACRTNCQKQRCGDGIEDVIAGEVCDDGNLAAADGCTPDCKSKEVCGNKIPDLLAGELCDDGNHLSRDGCSSTCQLEAAVWTKAGPGTPAGRYWHAMAYDAARGRIVMFGGTTANGGDAATWEWDGGHWTDVTPTSGSPTPRSGSAMAFDASRGVVVLFGGGSVADTWEWNGTSWTNVTPASGSPVARSGHGMAYDPVRKRVMLFGGRNSAGNRNDTWEWDGEKREWTQVTPSSGNPSPRSAFGLVYDAAHGRVVMFGGNGSSGALGDTHVWTGSAWMDVTPVSGSPGARSDTALAYDMARMRVVLYGGQANLSTKNDTWEWDGSAWTKITTAPSGTADGVYGHAMAYDVARGRVLLFGGYLGPSSTSSTTWDWNGTTWRKIVPRTTSPRPRAVHSMVYDAARGKMVVFGGSGGGYEVFGDTQLWDGLAWDDVTPSSGGPAARYSHASAYDAARARVVMFGGYDGTKDIADTWEWNGGTWTDRTPSTGNPPVRESHAMSYDTARGKVVLFGGYNDVNDVNLADTWEWNGTSWSNVTPASGNPPARYGHAMAFDAARNKTVMMGGFGDSGDLNDVWEWNGTSWTNATPAGVSPSIREGHAMFYDAAWGITMFGGAHGMSAYNDTWRWNGTAWSNVTPASGNPPTRYAHALAYGNGHAVLFGGLVRQSASVINHVADVWEWNGSAWTQVTPLTDGPPPRAGMAMTYDIERERVVLFGGVTSSGNRADTWVWDGTAWTNVTPPLVNPPGKYGHALAYDAVRKRVVLFGGGTADTWEWDGTGWADVTPASGSPPPRYFPSLTYDPVRARIILYGGDSGGIAFLEDTWEWDGSAWSDVTPATVPALTRDDNEAAYDVARARLVSYSGYGPNPWEWDGSAWMEVIPADGPPPGRNLHAMTYDASRGRIMMFGGISNVPLADTWEWSGLKWRNVTPTVSPPPRAEHATAYDAARGELVMFGGDSANPCLGCNGTSRFGDTWTLRYQNAEPREGCLSGLDGDGDKLVGCADPDCFAYCSPLCNPTIMSCDPAWPHCGDGMCQPNETWRLCPTDCTTPTPLCGDFLCDPSESLASCPGDCS